MTSVPKLAMTDLGVQPQQDDTKENGETVHQYYAEVSSNNKTDREFERR